MQLLVLLIAVLPATLAVPTEGYFVYADAETTPIAALPEANNLTRRSSWCQINGGDKGINCYRSPCKDGYMVGKFVGLGQFEFACWQDGGYDNDS
jgi:hypothetical protein